MKTYRYRLTTPSLSNEYIKNVVAAICTIHHVVLSFIHLVAKLASAIPKVHIIIPKVFTPLASSVPAGTCTML